MTLLGRNISVVRNGREYREFAEWLSTEGKIDPGNISKYEKNKVKPSYEFFLALTKRNINLNWLLTGEGEMYMNNKTDSELAKTVRQLQDSLSEKNQIIEQIKGLLSKNNAETSKIKQKLNNQYQ